MICAQALPSQLYGCRSKVFGTFLTLNKCCVAWFGKIMVEARVEYDYKAENVDELTLRTGDLITNVVQKDGGWWEGKLNGKYGLFPENFVKICNKDQSKVQSDLKTNGVPFRSDKKRKCRVVYSYTPVNDDELELEVDSVIDVLEEVEEGWWKGLLNGRIGVFPSNFVEELAERPGSSRDSKSSKDSSSSSAQDKYLYKDNTDSTSKDIKPKPVRGVGLGNIIFQDECMRFKQTQDSPVDKKSTPPKKPPPPSHLPAVNDAPVLPPKPGAIPSSVRNFSNIPEYSKYSETATSTNCLNCTEDIDIHHEHQMLVFMQSPHPAHQCASDLDLRLPLHLLDSHTSSSNDTNVREQARVLYPYDACNDDELTLKEGDIITILSKDIEDKGWWKGELNNKIGVFPDNFVEVITVPETRLKKPERPSLINKSASARHISDVEKSSEAPPPLPDYPKKLSSELLKKDERSERPDKPLIPPIPCKKPQLPPPLKKPQKPVAPAPPVETLTDDMKAKSQGTGVPETVTMVPLVDESAFDSIELTSDKLTHLTATRVRYPHRRPPSHLFLKDTSSTVQESQNDEVFRGREANNTDYNSNSFSAQLNKQKEFVYESEEQVIKSDQICESEKAGTHFMRKELPEKPVLRPPLPKTTSDIAESQSPVGKSKPYGLPPKPSTLSKEEAVSKPAMQNIRINKTSSGDDSSLVLELRQEILYLKNQVSNLQQNIENCSAMYNEKIEALTQEITAEKKVRLSMQVEIERLKKMVKEH